MALTAARESSGGGALALAAAAAAGGGGKVYGGGGGGGGGGGEWREHMFDKVVTPSDVGKLNRLVVPKHFAERYFPLGTAAKAGAVLRFEDARGGGAAWRFRFSYWSSSQSYVMTKGWSSFVRDRRLAAGDTVSFWSAGPRLFIDCRRRGGGGGSASTAARPVVRAPPVPLALQQRRTTTTSPDDDGATRRYFRLFGVDLHLGDDQPPLDLQLALR